MLLTVVGTETLRKVHKPSQIVFAGIPAFFAVQQFAEGAVWLTIPRKEYAALLSAATYIFIIMAQVIWPLLIPLSVLFMENHKVRKRILYALLAAGGAAAVYYTYSLAFYSVHAEISRMHITYKSAFESPYQNVAMLLYLTATLIPLFVSSVKRTYILGVIMSLSFIVSYVFYTEHLTSVWCFFAAVLSFAVFYIIRDSHKKFHVQKT